jgi:hypothetical protein
MRKSHPVMKAPSVPLSSAATFPNDVGAFATYGQAGQNYGTTLLWTMLLLSKAHASAPAESTRFNKGLCGLSDCGTPTNLFIAVYR